jgi:putative transposase
MKNALLPQSGRYGPRSKEHKSPDRHAPKRGRPSMVAKYTGVATGVNIDETIKEYFRRGTNLYYENAEKMPMIGAFRRILALFFHQGKELRNGRFIPLLPPANELPTWNQYRYWYRQEHDLTRSIAAHEGQLAPDAGERAVLGDPRQKILGPGRQFEIHVVIGDIYLVSMLDRRRILGQPVIYIIVDVFSGLIVGMYVSLEGPKPEGAMLAIENMARDKVAYCREYDVDISEDDWPSHHLPKAIVASRSELLHENADILVKALGVEVSNTQPCRLDWRESFERCFPLRDDMTTHWVLGSVNSLPEPGRKGHRLDSCLTLNEFRRLVIDCIIEHNLAHRLSDDYLNGDMIADSVEPYPRDLWKWGIQNRSGALRTLPVDTVRRNLLPEAGALVTPEGIYFHGMLYTCDEAIQKQWFEQAHRGKKRSLNIPIVYDPSVVDQIYVCLQGDLPLKACKLLEKGQIEFQGCAWFDIEDLITRYMSERATGEQIRQQRAKHCVMQDHISEEAPYRVSEVRENRAAERLQEREANTWDFQGQEVAVAGQEHLIFKEPVERIFASDNDKLFH